MLGRSLLALLAFSAVLAFVLQEQWAVPPVQPLDAKGFSAERTRRVLKDLAACGPKYVGFQSNEVCAVEALWREINQTLSEEDASKVLLDQQSASGHYYLDFIGGLTVTYRNLTNLLVKVPGLQKSGCALLISSHFDSALGSPAASDANAEMAIMTDLLRLMLRDPMPIDVIFNFNGGEEMLMPAAHGFVTSHPWATSLCAQINLEAGGSGGRELLFQAGPSNRWIAEAYKSHVQRPYGSSITQALFHTGLIPGETDFRIYRDFGNIPGADFAVLTNGWVYHTWRDDLAHLDFRSVQRYGETVHEFARGMASKLKAGRPSGAEVTDAAVFFDVGGLFFVEYAASTAQQLHIATSLVILTALLLSGGFGVLAAAMKLLLCAVMSLLSAVLSGACIAYTPAAMVAAGHPELAPFLFGPPALMSFLGCFHSLGIYEVEKGSIALAAAICLALSASPITVMASYLFLIWSLIPVLAVTMASVVPIISAPLVVGSYILPWMLYVQMLVLGLDFLSPLTFRSGTTIPGDVVVGGFYGLMTGLLLSLSAQFFVQLRRRDVMVVSVAIFFLSLLLAFQLFPYSYDRPKRVFQQHVARSQATWHTDPQGQSSVQWEEMEHGLWTTAMDWNNVATLQDFTPYGLPAGSRRHNDSAGIYGQVPMPFPMKAFLVGGAWAPRDAPKLPSKISLDLAVTNSEGLREVFVSARGPPQMMMVLSPASKVVAWTYGRNERRMDMPRPSNSNDPYLRLGLPRKRSDCDCFFLLYAEGGPQPSYGEKEAFNFTVLVPPGEMHFDVWALHLETMSPELQYEEERFPSWVAHMGWVSELQVHKIVA